MKDKRFALCKCGHEAFGHYVDSNTTRAECVLCECEKFTLARLRDDFSRPPQVGDVGQRWIADTSWGVSNPPAPARTWVDDMCDAIEGQSGPVWWGRG